MNLGADPGDSLGVCLPCTGAVGCGVRTGSSPVSLVLTMGPSAGQKRSGGSQTWTRLGEKLVLALRGERFHLMREWRRGVGVPELAVAWKAIEALVHLNIGCLGEEVWIWHGTWERAGCSGPSLVLTRAG